MKSEWSQAELSAVFIGPRAPSYLATGQGTGTFSWAGLIFGVYWLLYRKMYAYFFFVVALGFFIGILSQIIGVRIEYVAWLGLLPHLVLGLIGKRLYVAFAEEKVNAYLHHSKYNEKVFAEAGGTAVSLPLLWLFIQIVTVLMLTTPFLKY